MASTAFSLCQYWRISLLPLEFEKSGTSRLSNILKASPSTTGNRKEQLIQPYETGKGEKQILIGQRARWEHGKAKSENKKMASFNTNSFIKEKRSGKHLEWVA
jgi:hypothetical protein